MTPTHASPRVVRPPHEIFRIGRSQGPIYFSRISAQDAALTHAGNRFDIPGAEVCYFSSSRRGCYAETLARFRPSAAIRAAVAEEDESFMLCGGIPRDLRVQRLMVSCALPRRLHFLDVEAPQTHEYLTTELAASLTGLGIDVLDVASVRGRNRQVTRLISHWAYTQTGSDGVRSYDGLRYVSRLGNYECWAVFDGAPIVERRRENLLLTDADLATVCDDFGLRAF